MRSTFFFNVLISDYIRYLISLSEFFRHIYKTTPPPSYRKVSPTTSFTEKVMVKLEEYDTSTSYGKLSIMVQLRTMFQKAELREAIDCIDAISDKRHLNVLIGVGMTGALFYKINSRMSYLMGL